MSEKIKAVKITIDRAEGPTKLCGPKTFEGADVWEQAQRCIDNHCMTAPDKGGYDKTDFKVIFADGEEYDGRIDLAHPTYEKRDISNLADHIAQHCLFHIGHWCPSHMSQEKYWELLARYRKYDAEVEPSLRKFWQNYDIPSNWAKSLPTFA